MNPPPDGRMKPDALLQLEKVSIRFGGLTAVSELDLAIAPAELAGLIGPNGAGKTTVFNLVTGVYLGYDKPRGMGRGISGGHTAAPVVRSAEALAAAAPSILHRSTRRTTTSTMWRVT